MNKEGGVKQLDGRDSTFSTCYLPAGHPIIQPSEDDYDGDDSAVFCRHIYMSILLLNNMDLRDASAS